MMHGRTTQSLCCAPMGRRRLLAVAGTAAAGWAMAPQLAFAMTERERNALTPDQILGLMKQGNARFRANKPLKQDHLTRRTATARGQYPAAVILSCIDSRVPAEIVLDLRLGDVFNTRVAGNVAETHLIGSLEFACAISGAKVVLVMGHTACGAVKGAIDKVTLGNLTRVLDLIQPAVTSTPFAGERTTKNAAFVDAVCHQNVELTLATIRKESPILAAMEKEGKVKLAGAMYHLETGVAEFFV